MSVESPDEQPPLIVTDKRRVDVEGPVAEAAPAVAEPSYLEDLQRLKAEFDNYRRRKETELAQAGTFAQARLVADLLGVLDDVERARSHGELDPGFRSVADGVEKVLTGAGLVRFGIKGDPFDPARHEALQHFESPEILNEQVAEVFRPGYLFAGRVLRPAQVVVVGPAAVAGVEDDELDAEQIT